MIKCSIFGMNEKILISLSIYIYLESILTLFDIVITLFNKLALDEVF